VTALSTPLDVAASWLAVHGADLVALRRDLHAHPELGREEVRTTAVLTERLHAAGVPTQPLPGGTGLWCEVGTAGGPVVLLRADIDALPLDDEKDVPYRSTLPGVCHACGHDVHATIAVGAALALAAAHERLPLPGLVRIVFQPAEELMPGGATDVVAAGLCADASVALALHCDPTLDVGRLGVKVGAITSAADRVEVLLRGPGGHTSRPYRTVDMVSALAAVATEVPATLARRLDARAGVSLVWGSVHSGVASNAIPDRGALAGTVRMLDIDLWREVPGVVEELVHQVAVRFGAEVSVTYTRGVPPVVNDRRASGLLSHAADAVLGPGSAVPTQQSLGGEDFSWILEAVPGAMARLGVRPLGWVGRDLDLHQGRFDVDEAAIGIGARVLTRAALDALDVD